MDCTYCTFDSALVRIYSPQFSSASGVLTQGTVDSPGPVTHPQGLTEQGAHWTGEPPTPPVLMAHVESLKQNSILRINFRYKMIMRAMYKMSTSCWAVINNSHWLWKIALFLLVTSPITVSYWTCCSIAHPYTECRGEWFPIVIIASIKIMMIIEWDNIHDDHHSPPLYKLYNLSIWRHNSPPLVTCFLISDRKWRSRCNT